MAACVDLEIQGPPPDHPTEETIPRTEKRKTVPSLSALAILKKETNPGVFSLGFDEICRRLYSGILLFDQNKDQQIANQKFWVDSKLDKNCFLVLSKAMAITWSNNIQYWEYVVEKETCFEGEVDILVAKLKNVCWLDARGKFRTMVLSPKTTYEVSFEAKMTKDKQGWHIPITVNLYLPDGSTQGRTENLQDKQVEKWFRIPIGSFTTNPKNVGELSFSLAERGGHWKSGLIIKGLLLEPQD